MKANWLKRIMKIIWAFSLSPFNIFRENLKGKDSLYFTGHCAYNTFKVRTKRSFYGESFLSGNSRKKNV